MVLYLDNTNNNILTQVNRESDIKVCSIYKNGFIIKKAIQRLIVKKRLKSLYKYAFDESWYENQKEKCDIIIIEALKGKRNVIEYLVESFPDSRIVLWYWNTVNEYTIDPNDDICKKCELWSFDEQDCKKYGMYYNSQYYNKKINVNKNMNIVNDIYFIGQDKGRYAQIKLYEEKFKNLGLRTQFHVTADRNKAKNKNIKYKKGIPYIKVVEEISKSRAILDIPIDNQVGLTLRPLEAIFFSKKLITTNRDIINYPFYSHKNVFILGKDKLENLINFLNGGYQEINKNIIDYYDFESWIRRFYNR